MSRAQLFLSFALLAVAGTVAFMVTAPRPRPAGAERKSPPRSADRLSAPPSSLSLTAERRSSLRATQRLTGDRTHYEVSYAEPADAKNAAIIAEEAGITLEELTREYQLTPNQRREVYPLLVAHHPLFREGMLVNGRNVDLGKVTRDADLGISATSFDNALYPILNNSQQDRLQENILNQDRWWGDVLGKLDSDLEYAFENQEIGLADPDSTPSPQNPVQNLQP